MRRTWRSTYKTCSIASDRAAMSLRRYGAPISRKRMGRSGRDAPGIMHLMQLALGGLMGEDEPILRPIFAGVDPYCRRWGLHMARSACAAPRRRYHVLAS